MSTVWAVGQGVKYALLPLVLPAALLKAVRLVAMGVTFYVVLRRLHWWGMKKAVRRKLLDYDVPVCIGCGYSLRGLAGTSDCCPECGRGFDDRVHEILSG